MDAADLIPLAGGWSGQTFLAEAGGQRSVVRIYPPGLRDEAAPEIDAAVLHLVRGLVPVPEVLEVRRGVAAADRPGLLVTSWLPGQRGDLVVSDLDDGGLARLGRHVGRLVGILGGMPTLRPGPFVDPSLQVGDFGLADGLPGFVEAAGLRWDPDLVTRLVGVATDAQALLDTVGRACLVHSDLNPKNLLVDPDTLEVTAVLDWEFAHSGHPFTDLGNVLRFDRAPAYVEGVLAGYRERHAVPAADALTLARAADLWALVDLASRAGQNPVADRADQLLRTVAAQGDLHAVPAGWTPDTPPA
ncbi:MAG: aminoglycoside phosphotransferase family protein [Nocardioides sp.]